MIPLNYQPDRCNLTNKKKSNTKRFHLFCMYEIYLLAESVSNCQPKIQIERKKPVLISGKQIVYWRETKERSRWLLLFFFLLTGCSVCAWLLLVTPLSAAVSHPSLNISVKDMNCWTMCTYDLFIVVKVCGEPVTLLGKADNRRMVHQFRVFSFFIDQSSYQN